APTYAQSQFMTDLANAACSSTVVASCGGDAAACAAKIASVCADQRSASVSFVPCARAGMPYVGGDVAKKCVATVKSAYDDGKVSKDELAAITNDCGRVFSPAAQSGGQCASDLDCAGALKCFLTGPGTGTCLTPKPIGNGLQCDNVTDGGAECGDGFACIGS